MATTYQNSLETEALFRDGKRREALALTREAYRQLPNNIKVKEKLMSNYFDTDKIKYRDEIVNLGTEIAADRYLAY